MSLLSTLLAWISPSWPPSQAKIAPPRRTWTEKQLEDFERCELRESLEAAQRLFGLVDDIAHMIDVNGVGNATGCVKTVVGLIGQCKIHGANFQDYNCDDEEIYKFAHTNLLK